LGHPRVDGGYWLGGLALTRDIFPLLGANPGYFRNVEVGMMSPIESFLEMSLAELARQRPVPVMVCAADQALDIDRPWDIMAANWVMANRLCGALTENRLAEGSSIDPTAQIKGHVALGKNSRIGRNVTIEGSCIVGDDTRIDNGAILLGNNVIGDRCTITNYCYLDEGAVVGHDCVINHCAEFGGVLFDGVFLYHYMEMHGIIGEHTDIGAGTACGTLRFDDGETTIRVKGRPERPRHFSNATYLGDFCRTGVNVTIAPGKRIGCYSVIGAGTIVQKDVPERTLIYAKQELEERPWGPEMYGW
jgi:UDP-N-acetylglucosamine diphosphorylase / glucose-1-phosphate thymidylyltransferase / UDP-N-acetylgalactosamine diphosphorylase / glucosamine-1-phosphate N-acetyltransferase / galactosamine-1-phosphate N-acetyltransferase